MLRISISVSARFRFLEHHHDATSLEDGDGGVRRGIPDLLKQSARISSHIVGGVSLYRCVVVVVGEWGSIRSPAAEMEFGECN